MQKLNKKSNPSSTADSDATISSPANEEQTADILKLNIDCCEEAFDYLVLKDLVSVSKTCKRLQQAAGNCFQQNFSDSFIWCHSSGILTWSQSYEPINVTNFAPIIGKIQITPVGLSAFLTTQSKLHQLKQMELHDLDFTRFDSVLGITHKIWNKLEVLQFVRCDISDSFQNIIGAQCVELRHLEIENCNGKPDWFHRKYPLLESLKIISRYTDSISKFLQLNPNVRKLGISAGLLLEQRNEIMATNIQLDTLAIHMDELQDNSIFNLLKKLHDRHFYTRLYWNFREIKNQEEIDQLATVNGLHKLHVWYRVQTPFTIEALTDLEEIRMAEELIIANGEQMVNFLINLKGIYVIGSCSIHTIMPFIRRSVRIKKIKINPRPGVYFNGKTGVIDLLALNEERRKLPGAEKITMYVKEKYYLATKWKFGVADLEFIRLKRENSFNWDAQW